MNLFVATVDVPNRFILGLLFYFVSFGIATYTAVTIFSRIRSYEEIFLGGMVLFVIGLIPAGIYVNRRLLATVKGKFLRSFLIVIQLVISYMCLGVFLYGFFWAFLWSLSGKH